MNIIAVLIALSTLSCNKAPFIRVLCYILLKTQAQFPCPAQAPIVSNRYSLLANGLSRTGALLSDREVAGRRYS